MYYALGLDLSTQSLSVCIFDILENKIIGFESVAYKSMSEIKNSKMDIDSLIIKKSQNQAEQDPYIFIVALERVLDLISQKYEIQKIVSIQISAQQHGHVYLNEKFSDVIKSFDVNKSLWQQIKNCFSYDGAPIWRSADTKNEADALRESVGGHENMINITGSDSPLRFTGAIIKKIANQNPEAYKQTSQIQLLNTFLASILTGEANLPCDFANATGTSLMNFRTCNWNQTLLDATAFDLQNKLGSLASSNTTAGNIATYFVNKYGFNKNCIVGIGTGDNPATKVLCEGDLLSLGTSFVYMLNIDKETRDYSGVSNAMYDGLDNPFMILCRTNGGLLWDNVMNKYKKNYEDVHNGLLEIEDELPIYLWQLESESVPKSGKFEIGGCGNFENEYKGIVLSSLALVENYIKNITTKNNSVLWVTGGAVAETEILQIISNLWNCKVRVLPKGGAALGAAFMACILFDKNFDIKNARLQILENKIIIEPQNILHGKIENYKLRILELVKPYLT